MALDFDGTVNQYIDIPSGALTNGGDVTATFWIKTSKTGGQAIVSGARSGEDNEYLIFFIDNTTLQFFFGGTDVSWTIASISDNVWHHVAVVRDDGNNEARLYIDGVPDNENPKAITLSAMTIDAGGLIVGQEQDSVGGGFDAAQALDGILDDLRFYSRVLSAAELQTIFAIRGVDGIVHGLLGRWPMDEGAPETTATGAGTIVDISDTDASTGMEGGAHHGDPIGSPVYKDSELRSRRRIA